MGSGFTYVIGDTYESRRFTRASNDDRWPRPYNFLGGCLYNGSYHHDDTMATETVNTESLLIELQAGSDSAFAKIYDHFSKPLYRNILHMVVDEDAAKELLQDLFLKFWIKRMDLDVTKPLKPYLYRMAANLTYNHFRKVAQDKRLISQLILTTVEHISNIEDAIVDRETTALLHHAISSLPPQRKRVFTLCKLEGKSYSEVTVMLGISEATINEHIVKANKTIKQYFLRNKEIAVLLIFHILGEHLKK
jgi:RNA polymerase sigma-70 factor (family 1)